MAEKRIEITKRIDNISAYIMENIFVDIWASKANCAGLSRDTVDKYYSFMDSLHRDIVHIKCDTITNEYIIECGYNIIK